MKNLILMIIPIFAMLAIILISCDNRTNSIPTNIIQIDSVTLKDSLFKEDLIKAEGIKAIGNINFFISEKEFKKEKEAFMKPLYSKEIYGWVLGDYKFRDIDGAFHNDSLLNVHIWGYYINYDEYRTKMEEQYNALFSILETKYGLPKYKEKLPEQYSVGSNDTYILAEWDLAFKEIIVWVACSDYKYRLDFVYYVPELADRSNKEEEKKIKRKQRKRR